MTIILNKDVNNNVALQESNNLKNLVNSLNQEVHASNSPQTVNDRVDKLNNQTESLVVVLNNMVNNNSNANEDKSKNAIEMAKEKLLPVVQETSKVDISKMSMLERTEHFEKLRKQKLEKKRIEKAEAEKTELEKKKNQLFIKRQQSNSRWSHVRSRLGTQALKTDANTKKKDSKSKSLLDDCRSLVGGKADSNTKENKSGAKKKSSKNQHETALKKKVVSKIRSRMTKRKESVKSKRPSLLDMCQGMLEGTQAATNHGLCADEVGIQKAIKADVNTATATKSGANATDEVTKSIKQDNEMPKEPEPAKTDKAQRYWQKNYNVVRTVFNEDFEIGENIQKGLNSGANKDFLFGRYEIGLHLGAKAIQDALSGSLKI